MKSDDCKHRLILFTLALGMVLFGSCKKDDPPDPEPDPEGTLKLNFFHYVDGQPLVVDTIMYENAAGNPYMVTEVQYFISDVILHRAGQDDILIDDWKDIHYVDNDKPSTMTWAIYDALEVGSYDSISFTFGITSGKNHTLMFVNPPERDMFWPIYLGGGYHYMKLNGKWRRPDNYVASYDFHLGIGQIYASDVIVVDSITGFVDNSTEISLPGSAFTLADDSVTNVDIVMNIENWFESPNVFDFDVYGGYVMQNQEAMAAIKENAWDVFTIGTVKGSSE